MGTGETGVEDWLVRGGVEMRGRYQVIRRLTVGHVSCTCIRARDTGDGLARGIKDWELPVLD